MSLCAGLIHFEVHLHLIENCQFSNPAIAQNEPFIPNNVSIDSFPQTMYETVIKLEHETPSSDTEIDLNNLDVNTLYRIMVIARGAFGNSLPSSMLLINTSKTNNDALVYGAPSPPHSLVVSSHGATYITVSWQPPEFSHPHERISYRMFHRSGNNVTVADTKMLWARLNRLTPNTQHIFYLTAIGSKGTSLPSETLVAWTDPALPAFVDVIYEITYVLSTF